MSRIAIIGGHGKVGLKLAPILAGQGHEVSAVIRNPDQTKDVESAGASALVADVEKSDAAEIADALRGHDAVVWAAGAGGGSPERTWSVDRDAAIRTIDAAVEAGVKRFVMVSYFGASKDHGVPEDDDFYAYAESKAEADEHLRGTKLDWTILGPSGLSDDKGTGLIEIGDGVEASKVSRDDVAEVAAAALAEPKTIGKFLEFNNGGAPIAKALASI
ncbi:SDR family oxidoreductase [Arthrobacter roseus]|uniref:SDR family oxidoreductase n=1 Tax=Arthrobacter roseus TaxID=136274 RepID=UPI001965E22E|nr:SDR family oxidoreductase [Arthrobacter roseus]MBM7847588.1 uncharacterized protein YbjT (DUF2867 family) [Arthrobacter roseus]